MPLRSERTESVPANTTTRNGRIKGFGVATVPPLTAATFIISGDFSELRTQEEQSTNDRVASSMEGLKKSYADLVVYMHPSKTNKVSQAIFRELSSLLFKFSEAFDGVVLAYEVNLREKLAKILPGIHPYFGVRLKAELLLFNPKPNMLLEGKVVKLAQQSIHVIVLGFSSAIITEEDIREEFKFKVKNGQEVFTSTSHKRHRIKVGTMLRFLVKSFDEEILHFSGSLLPSHTGSISWLEKNVEEEGSEVFSQRGSKKRQESDISNVLLNSDHHGHKKSKRQRSGEDS